jgi:TonB family protein
MIAWMLYAVLVAALFGGAALLAERALRMSGRPGRLAWAAAMGASAVVPVATVLLRRMAAATSPPGEAAVVQLGPNVMQLPVAAIERVGAATVSLDGVLVGAWIVTSLALLGWVAWAWIRIRRERATWITETVDGHRVFVSPDVGPAVVDPIEGGVVVPRWLLDAPAAERQIALRHELEHVLASDHRLLWGALFVASAFPWNVPLWWQLTRLRHAVELDCDRRVLAGGTSPRTYAELLLQVVGANRASRVRPALTEQPSFLRWRIGAMIERHIRFRFARSIGYGAVAAGLVFLACETEAPQALTESAGAGQSSVTSAQGAQIYDESVLDQAPERLSCPVPEYPALMREARIEGQVLLHFVVETDGAVDASTVEVLDASHRAFEAPATNMIAQCRFRPGRVDGNPVRALVQMPMIFHLAGNAPSSGPAAGEQAPIRIMTNGSTGDTVSLLIRRGDEPASPPLYVVDGVIVADRSALDLDALDIESIEVIKGSAAAARYGERGKNGVVLITTMRQAATSGTMRGTVFDPAGKPLANARLVIVGASSTTLTDSKGSYSLAVPAGTYTVRAEFGSFRPTEMAGVRILAGETLTADFRLAEGPARP